MLLADEHLTGSTMKHLINLKAAITVIMAAYLLMTSCIYEAPGDRLYRTLWKSSEAPLEGLTLEFHCDNWISARFTEDSLVSFSRYDPHRYSATFQDLSVSLGGTPIIIEEAHRQDDSLTIYWHLLPDETSKEATLPHGQNLHQGEQYSTRLHRLSAYE